MSQSRLGMHIKQSTHLRLLYWILYGRVLCKTNILLYPKYRVLQFKLIDDITIAIHNTLELK